MTVPLAAQERIDARWMWFDSGAPETEAPEGDVLFRREVYMDGPCTGEIWLAADDRFVLWVNGEKVGEGGGDRSSHFNLNGIVERGVNVIAVQATNTGGRAGLLVDGVIRHQNGSRAAFNSPAGWKTLRAAPQGDDWLQPGFDVGDWSNPAQLSTHADSPWSGISFDTDYLARFDLPDGFSLRRVANPQLLEGSIVAMTWGNRGRLIVSAERGPVSSLVDHDGDGNFDERITYSTAVQNCQGLCQVYDNLYVVGDGPGGTGMYRLPDADHDDIADDVELIVRYRGGMGEHGPHAVVFGPDGWLYNNMGNHAWITETPQPNSPVGKTYEGDVLQPRFQDANGHANGITEPGGSIWRFSPDGDKWWMHTTGFRNEYEMGFNSAGELFAFDSDMEWDVGLPWYRPVRINHCIAGAQFGWRSGAAKWPEYYFDSLPTTVDIGRGSPTGVVFYEHTAFPQELQGAFIVCDWSLGRIIAVHLSPDGATFAGDWETLVAGNPLNVSDIEVDRDGSLIFCTGGRGTEGGVYRLTHGDGLPAKEVASFADLLEMPQMQSAWAREFAVNVKRQLGDQAWQQAVNAAARSDNAAHQVRALTLAAQVGPRPTIDLLAELASDDDASVRQFAAVLLGSATYIDGRTVADTLRITETGAASDGIFNSPEDGEANTVRPLVEQALTKLLSDDDAIVRRRACEAFVQSGIEPPLQPVLAAIESDDRWLRYAGRLALERIPVEKWKESILTSNSGRTLTHGLLALFRKGQFNAAEGLAAFESFIAGGAGPQTPMDVHLDALRLLELMVWSGDQQVAQDFLAKHQVIAAAPRDGFDHVARLAALSDSETSLENLTALLGEGTRKDQIYYALCLAYADSGWTIDTKGQLLDWYETTRDWDGGNSFKGYLRNIIGASVVRFSPEDRRDLLADWRQRPFASQLLLTSAGPGEIADFSNVMAGMVAQFEAAGDDAQLAPVLEAAFGVLGEDGGTESKAVLHDLYERFPDSRESIVRAMCRNPSADDAEFLWQSLRYGNETTLQVAVGALSRLEQRPEEAAKLRDLILAGLKLDTGGRGRRNRANIVIGALATWTETAPRGRPSAAESLAFYQNWFAEEFPNESPAELPPDRVAGLSFTNDELIEFLASPEGSTGDVAAGQEVFAKANCAKCHKFGDTGEGIGPDLTGLRRRFQRKEIVDSLMYPSAVISDQYKSVVVETTTGLIHTGMPVADPTTDDLVLLLPDATKLRIKRDEIDAELPATTSVMPEGVLQDISLQDVADLLEYLETSKEHELPAGGG